MMPCSYRKREPNEHALPWLQCMTHVAEPMVVHWQSPRRETLHEEAMDEQAHARKWPGALAPNAPRISRRWRNDSACRAAKAARLPGLHRAQISQLTCCKQDSSCHAKQICTTRAATYLFSTGCAGAPSAPLPSAAARVATAECRESPGWERWRYRNR